MDHKDMWVTYPSTVGPITVISTRRKNRPAGRCKPYEYVLPMKESAALVAELRAALKDLEKKGFQCAAVWRKGLAKGVKVSFFILGYKPGLCGTTTGVTLPEWEAVTKLVQDILTEYLGEDAKAYIEPYSEDAKFQSRWEAYVMHEEFNA